MTIKHILAMIHILFVVLFHTALSEYCSYLCIHRNIIPNVLCDKDVFLIELFHFYLYSYTTFTLSTGMSTALNGCTSVLLMVD
jgi:hypothetical protein